SGMNPLSTDRQEMERLLARFDQAWRGGQPPRIEEFLPSGADASRRYVLEELIKVDLEYRWRCKLSGNNPWALEEYVRRFPELGPWEKLSVGLIAQEYEVRHSWGDQPSRQAYLTRFAGHGNGLAQALMQVEKDLAAESGLNGAASLPMAVAARPVP